jgi:hypothetical protein
MKQIPKDNYFKNFNGVNVMIDELEGEWRAIEKNKIMEENNGGGTIDQDETIEMGFNTSRKLIKKSVNTEENK